METERLSAALEQAPAAKRTRDRDPKARGVFQKNPGSGVYWIRYTDAHGRFRREKAGTKGAAIDLYRKRKMEALTGKKLPEKLRRATVTFADIAKDALSYSKQYKRDYRHDAGRMETLLAWFREYSAEAITAQDIERRFAQQEWSPATCNRMRALLSLTYRLAIRAGRAKENPARLVKHRLENNARVRFLSADEETALRKAIEGDCPERLPELELALHTGMRVSEQYGLTWADVSFAHRVLTIQRSKNGSVRHVPLNQSAIRALETEHQRTGGGGFVCGGSPGPRLWFEPVVRKAKIADFHWHDLRHTFASRLTMAGVDLRTVQELMGHKTIAMTVRYSHLAPKHTLAAVERLDALASSQSETSTAGQTDTTTDTGHIPRSAGQLTILQ